MRAAEYWYICIIWYIQFSENINADHELRRLELETEYNLSRKAFKELCNNLGQLEIDWSKLYLNVFAPFASTPKVPLFCSNQIRTFFLLTENIIHSGLNFSWWGNIIEQAFSLKGMIPETIKISISLLTNSSVCQYDSALKKWWEFCNFIDTSVVKALIPGVLKFLSSEFKKGASYGTINSLRSAVALISGSNIKVNQNVKRFCRGVERSRPSCPKYDKT